MSKPAIIAITNQKGGAGKTTTAVNLSAGLSSLGKRVLLVDLDSQCNATSHLGFKSSEFEQALDDLLFKDDVSAQDVIQERGDLHFIPASINLTNTEQHLSNTPGREHILAEKLNAVEQDYDFIVLDCPPNLGVLVMNALCAATDVIVPLKEYFSLEGINRLLQVLSVVKKRLNPDIKISGVLLTNYDDRKNMYKQIRKQVKESFGSRVFNTVIRTNSKISEAPMNNKTIYEQAPKSNGATDYLNFSKEVGERYVR